MLTRLWSCLVDWQADQRLAYFMGPHGTLMRLDDALLVTDLTYIHQSSLTRGVLPWRAVPLA